MHPISKENIVTFQPLRSELTHRAQNPRNAPKPSRSGWPTWWIELFVIVAAGSVFALLADEVWEKEVFRWDAPIMLAIHQFRTPWLDTLMLWVSDFGLPRGLIVITICLWMWYQHHRKTALTIALSYGGSFLIAPVVKLIFTRQRPAVFEPLRQLTDYSFPSGHTLGAITLYGLLAYLCWQHRHYIWACLSLLPAILIPLSRVYLGVHYPSDILGAMALGVAWISAVHLVCRLLATYTQNFNLAYTINRLNLKIPPKVT